MNQDFIMLVICINFWKSIYCGFNLTFLL